MKKLSFFFSLGALLLASCEDLVEVDNPSNQLGRAQVFDHVQTANAALAGLYAGLRDQSVISGAGYYTINTLSGSYTDDLECFLNDQNGVMDLYRSQPLQTNTYLASVWKTAYQQIYYANSILDGTAHSAGLSAADKNRIKGEALLARSLVYFYLQQFFGDIPYTVSLDYEYNRNLSKTQAAAVLEQLETDVTEAAGLLEDVYRDTERIYPNRKAAQLLLARIYLLKGEWALAEQTAQSILQSPLYQFQADINEVFHKTGSHILWQLKPQNSGDASREGSFYYFSGAAPNAYALTEDLVSAFAGDDLRKQAWMTRVSFNGSAWYRPFKYRNRLNGSNTDEYSVVFRLEEAYFIMAEALARQDRFDEALPYLNASRQRAGLDALPSLPGESFWDELLAEKRREFFTEAGHRFLDLKRLGRLEVLKALKPTWKDDGKLWPLPQNELLLNVNLNPQNPGY